MDWNYAIERNRDALKRVLAALVAMAGLGGGTTFTSPLWGRGATAAGRPRAMEMALGAMSAHKGEVGSEVRPTLPRHLHRAVLRLLRPAESAARRLVIIAARGLVVPSARPRAAKPKPAPPAWRSGAVTGIWMPPGLQRRPGARQGSPERQSKGRPPCLPLFDRLPRLGAPSTDAQEARPLRRGFPRICVPGLSAPLPVPPERQSKGRPPRSPDDAIDAGRLQLRLAALAGALDDLSGQARRYARWRMRAANAARAGKAQAPRPAKARRVWPLKPGRPPGLARRPVHDVHEILRDAHSLALRALDSFDTS